MIKKSVKQLHILFIDALQFLLRKLNFRKPAASKEIIYLNFNNPNLYHRYFYNLIKTFQIAGYQIIYPMNFSKFRNLRNGDVYLGLMLKEPDLVDIRKQKIKDNFIILSDKQFSENYYEDYFLNRNLKGDSYHVPMSFHPFMYHYNHWNKDIPKVEKINSIFCFGNFDREAYKKIHQSPFKIIDRVEILDFFSTKVNFTSIKCRDELQDILKRKPKNQIIFSEKKNFNIPMSDIREIVNNFRFFVCCPGVFAPLSHNFVEALSVGAIPIIEKEYASVIYPELTHLKNAIIFESLNDLEKILENTIFSISEVQYLEMYNATVNYYNTYLHPASAGRNIVEHLYKKVLYLNASERSIKLKK